MDSPRKGQDWTCPSCSIVNFASRTSCFKCGTDCRSRPLGLSAQRSKAPLQSLLSHPRGQRQSSDQALIQPHPLLHSKSGGGGSGAGLSNKLLPGDWICPSCHLNNFAARVKCISCGASHEGALRPVDRVGDWACPNDGCRFHNFANRRECHRCGTRKPKPVQMGAFPRRGHMAGPVNWLTSKDLPPPATFQKRDSSFECVESADSTATLVDDLMDLPAPISELAPGPIPTEEKTDGQPELPIKTIFRDYGQSFFSSNPFASYGFRNESSS
jgi:hypothetical protein